MVLEIKSLHDFIRLMCINLTRLQINGLEAKRRAHLRMYYNTYLFTYTGMFPFLFQGLSSLLFQKYFSAVYIFPLVCRGSMISSTC